MGYLKVARGVLEAKRGQKPSPVDTPDERTKEVPEEPVLEPVEDLGSPSTIPIDWPRLAAQRWGPAVEDPEPGIIIDRPDPERRRAAIEALGSGHGDAWEPDDDDSPGPPR